MTLKLHSAVPHPFDATQVTPDEPIGNTEPDGGKQTTDVPAGVTVAEKITRALLLQVSTVMSSGHSIFGGSPFSCTFTNLQELFKLQRSSAVHVTVVVPQGNKLPDAGTHVTETLPLLSEAEGGGYVTTAPQPAGPGQALTTMLLGH